MTRHAAIRNRPGLAIPTEVEGALKAMKKVMFAAVAALSLAACDDRTTVESLQTNVGSTIDEQGVAAAAYQAIDREALRDVVKEAAVGPAKGALDQAIREAVPEEVVVLGSVIDEEAVVSGVNAAVDEKELGRAVQGAVQERLPAR